MSIINQNYLKQAEDTLSTETSTSRIDSTEFIATSLTTEITSPLTEQPLTELTSNTLITQPNSNKGKKNIKYS